MSVWLSEMVDSQLLTEALNVPTLLPGEVLQLQDMQRSPRLSARDRAFVEHLIKRNDRDMLRKASRHEDINEKARAAFDEMPSIS